MTYPENHEWKEFLAFRDYLKECPAELVEYARLKEEAALKADNQGEQYRKMKEPFIQKIKSLIKKRKK